MERKYSQKEMENAVMLAADLYQKFYNARSVGGGSLEVANVIIDEAVKMEKWLVEKYGPDDEEYLDRLDEYEAMMVKEYELEEENGDVEEKLMVLCSYDSDEQEFDDHLIVNKKVFYSPDGKERIRKYLNEAFEYENMNDDDRKEFCECVKNLLKGGVGYFGIKYFWEETTAIL